MLISSLMNSFSAFKNIIVRKVSPDAKRNSALVMTRWVNCSLLALSHHVAFANAVSLPETPFSFSTGTPLLRHPFLPPFNSGWVEHLGWAATAPELTPEHSAFPALPHCLSFPLHHRECSVLLLSVMHISPQWTDLVIPVSPTSPSPGPGS